MSGPDVIVWAGNHRLNVNGTKDREDALRLASEHWAGELSLALSALVAIARNDVRLEVPGEEGAAG